MKAEKLDPGSHADMLNGARTALHEASRCLISSSLDPGDCLPLLEEAQRSLEAFQAQAGAIRTADQAGLYETAVDLRDSLEMFSALALRWRAYFESFAAELLGGQMNYDAVSAKAFTDSELERPVVDL